MIRRRPSPRVLIVSSDRATRQSTTQILAQEGFVVEAAPVSDSAVKRVRRHHPEAILIDLADAGDGSSLVATCREEVGSDATRILAMAPTPRAALTAILEGAHGYVKTPVDRATIVPMLVQVHLVPVPSRKPSI